MTQSIVFLTPRLVGDRFADHAIPLEILKDLAALEEMILEVAKWRYLQEHPDRKRSPRGFIDDISLKLTAIEPGSACPRIEAVFETPGIFPPDTLAPANFDYFIKARDSIFAAVDAAERGDVITRHLPDFLLGYFDRFGRTLHESERIELDPLHPERPARLSKATRRSLILASQIDELTNEVTLQGRIPTINQVRRIFDLQLPDGSCVSAPLDKPHAATVLEALAGYEQGARVRLQGIGRYDRTDRLRRIDAVEHLNLSEPNDIAARLDELRALPHGWLDGKGFAPEPAGLDWLAKQFEVYYPERLPLPFLYPTAEGGVQAEWSFRSHEVTLDINLARHQADWHALHLPTEEESLRTLDLDTPAAWSWLSAEVGLRSEAKA